MISCFVIFFMFCNFILVEVVFVIGNSISCKKIIYWIYSICVVIILGWSVSYGENIVIKKDWVIGVMV